MGSLDKPSTDNNISDKNIKTVIFFIAIIFLGVVFFLGGGVPVILAFFVFVYVGLSLRKQFSGKHESSVDVSEKKEETLVSESSDKSVHSEIESAKSKSQPVRRNGESFDSFMMRRFGLSKVDTKTEDDVKASNESGSMDDLYNADQYESVNDDLSNMDPDLITINGKQTRFHHKDNPFEM